jgi:hypothetical protein
MTKIKTRKQVSKSSITPTSNSAKTDTSTSATDETNTTPPKTLLTIDELRPVAGNIRIHQLDVYKTDEDNFTPYRSGESNLTSTDDTTNDTENTDEDNTTEDTETEDDSTKFKLHQGSILETYSYNQLHSVDFSKDYEQCTGEGKTKIRYKNDDLKKLYKGQKVLLCTGRQNPNATKKYTETEINTMIATREKELLNELISRKKQAIKDHAETEEEAKKLSVKSTTDTKSNSNKNTDKNTDTDSTSDTTKKTTDETSTTSTTLTTPTIVNYIITNKDTEKTKKLKNKLNSAGAKEDSNPTIEEKKQIHQQAVDEVHEKVTGLYHSLNGWIVDETFTQEGTELSFNDSGKLLEQEDTLTYENMYRSKIIEEVIKTAGLIPIVDFTGLNDDVISWTSKSSSGKSDDGSANGDGSMTEQQAIEEFSKFSYGGYSTHDPSEAWKAYQGGQRSFDCYGATAWWYHVLNFKVGITARDICYPSKYSHVSGTHHTIQIKKNGEWVDPTNYYANGNSSLKIISSRSQQQVCSPPPVNGKWPGYIKCQYSRNT